MTAREALDQIEQRAAGATPGPWSAGDPYVWKIKSPWVTGQAAIHSEVKDRQWVAVHAGDDSLNVANDVPAPNDAEFIAHARTDMPKLVTALRAVLGNHWCIEGGDECGYDGRIWPCPDVRAITEALGAS